jgi:hypothetical protein
MTKTEAVTMAAAGNVTVVTVTDPAEFDGVVAERASASACYVLVSGEKDPATGLSWCPDCVKADPVALAALNQLAHPVTLIYCPVVRSRYVIPAPMNLPCPNPFLCAIDVRHLSCW